MGDPKELMKKLEKCYEKYARYGGDAGAIEDAYGYDELMAALS